MIRPDYQPYLDRLKNELGKLGYRHVREDGLLAEFILSSGWTVEFECERHYGPAFKISLRPPGGESESFAIWILMEVFSKKTGASYGRPTIENQVKFLIEEQDRIFNSISFYADDYKRINESEM